MSWLPAQPAPTQPNGPAVPGTPARKATRVAAISLRGQVAHGICVQATPLGVRVLNAATMPAGEVSQLATRLAGEQTIIVLTPQAAIIRPVNPGVQLAGGAEQIASALALLAESQLPETIPAHRRSAGVLRHAAARSVVAIGWSGQSPTKLPGTATNALYLPAPIALLGALRVLLPHGGLLVDADATTGLLTIAACRSSNEGPVAVRVVRDAPADANAQAWSHAITSAASETAELLEMPLTLQTLGTLWLSDDPADVPGLAPGKLADFAIPLGAAVFALQAQPDERPLLGMLYDAPIARRTPALGQADRLGTLRRLGVAVAACCILLLGAYVAAQHLRLWALERRAGQAASDTTAFGKAVDQQQMLTLLRERRWPVLQLASHITAGMPEGVLIETLTLDQGRPLSITGTAPSAEVVNQWRAILVADRALAEVAMPQQAPVAEGAQAVRFTITAKVADALASVQLPGKSTPTTEQPGAQATPETPAPSARPPDPSGERPSARRPRAAETPATPTAPSPSRADAPAPLSESELSKLTLSQARIQWARRRGWSQNQTIDEPTRQRLTAEVEQLQRHIDELKSQTGGTQ